MSNQELVMTPQWKQRLKHPVALAAQGFLFGVVLFWSTAPSESSAQAAAPAASASLQASR
jgi:hypothetical protein